MYIDLIDVGLRSIRTLSPCRLWIPQPHTASPSPFNCEPQVFHWRRGFISFCLPRPRCPWNVCLEDSLDIVILFSPLYSLCPYHLSLASRTLSVMQATPMTRQMSSFLFLSSRLRQESSVTCSPQFTQDVPLYVLGPCFWTIHQY